MRIQSDARCSLLAPAKVNLCLELLGRRGDGFHEIRTLMSTVRLSDRLEVRAGSSTSLSLSVVGDPRMTVGVTEGPENLVLRALDALRNETGVRQGADVQLHKRIPSQAGLGGGSSDAAAAIIAGDRVWNLRSPLDLLTEVAARIGSDVPFFVRAISERVAGGIATGRGEKIRPVGVPSGLPLVIAKPAEGLATADVYKKCQECDYSASSAASGCERVASALVDRNWSIAGQYMKNALESAANRVRPAVGELRRAFDRAGFRLHQLSGSGSAYFGVARSWREARRMAARLRALRIGRVFVTTIGA